MRELEIMSIYDICLRRIKLHVRFDEGDAGSLLIIVTFTHRKRVSYQALLY